MEALGEGKLIETNDPAVVPGSCDLAMDGGCGGIPSPCLNYADRATLAHEED